MPSRWGREGVVNFWVLFGISEAVRFGVLIGGHHFYCLGY